MQEPLQVGDRVLYVPRLALWQHRCYMLGTVQRVQGKYATVTSVCGEQEVVYTAQMIVHSKCEVSSVSSKVPQV